VVAKAEFIMTEQQSLMIVTICLLIIPITIALTTTESSTVTTSEKITTSEVFTTTDKETTTSTTPPPPTSSTAKTTSTSTTTPKPSSTSTSTTTTTEQPQVSTEWQDIEEEESQKLVSFVVSEIQKLKVEHKELDECQELDLSSVLSGKKLNGKTIKYSVTLKVQPQVKNTAECLQQNSTMGNMHPEICEADVTEGDRGGTEGKTLLRSTCLQVEELQD
jgi:hypothetical protein